jgi:hypothetical protein
MTGRKLLEALLLFHFNHRTAVLLPGTPCCPMETIQKPPPKLVDD